MDTFKIISIIFMMIVIYQIYQLNCTVYKDIEGFADVPVQSLGGVDDTNAINTLAQIAKNLMAGGVTVPGNMNIIGDLNFPNATAIKGAGRLHIGGEELLYLLNKKGVMIGKEWGGTGDLNVQGNVGVGGNFTTNGEIKFGGDNAAGFKWDNEGGNGWACLRAIGGKTDDSFCMHSAHGNGTRLHPGGDMTVKGRNILAEIDALKAQTIKNDETINLRLTKGIHPNGSVVYTANGPGDTVWVGGWNGALESHGDPNNWLAQFRIQKNGK